MAAIEQTPALAPLPMPAPPASASRWQKLAATASIFGRSRTALVGLVLVSFWVIVAIFADNCLTFAAS